MAATVSYVARPQVFVDKQVDEGLGPDVVSVLVEETIEGLYRCEVRLNNYGFRPGSSNYVYFGRDRLDFGKDLAVELGPSDRGGQVFAGRITAIEAEYPHHGGPLVVMLAEDRLQAMRMTRRTRVFEDVSDEDVIRQIAQEHSLTPDLTLNGPTHRALAQVNLSDLAFIRDRARAVNAEVWVEDATLFARARTDRAEDPLTLLYGGSLAAFTVRADLVHQCSELGVGGWDVAAKEAILETATGSDVASELGSDTGGGDVLEQAFAARTEHVVHTVPLTSDEARAIAQARYRERARRFVTGRGIADGDARIRVGRRLRLGGLGSLFDGEYYVVRARHTFDAAAGYQTEFEVERPGLGPAQA